MAITIDDVEKALKTISDFCDESTASLNKQTVDLTSVDEHKIRQLQDQQKVVDQIRTEVGVVKKRILKIK